MEPERSVYECELARISRIAKAVDDAKLVEHDEVEPGKLGRQGPGLADPGLSSSRFTALGLGSAAGVRAGNAVGAGDPATAIPRTLIAGALAGACTASLAAAIVRARATIVTGINSIVAFFIVTGGLRWALVRGGYGPLGLVYAAGLGMVTAAVLHGGRFAIVSARLRRRS